MYNVIILGNGGHAISVIDILFTLKYNILGTIKPDDGEDHTIFNVKTIGCDCDLPHFRNVVDFAYNGVGQIKNPSARINAYYKLKLYKFKIPPLISPNAYVSRFAKIGFGTSVHPKSFINAATIIKENCIINTGAIVEHGCEVGCNSHVSTGVILNGNVKVGQNCFIGSGSIVFQDSIIPDNSIIPAGSIIRR